MTNTTWSLSMERDELVRLAGEQALLAKEIQELSSLHQRDKNALQGLCNAVATGNFSSRNGSSLQDGVTLLTRLHDNEAKLRDLQGQLANLRKLTGL